MSFIDEKQKVKGKRQDFWDSWRDHFGHDKYWWLVPTHPCLQINYLERTYTKFERRQLKRGAESLEEDDWDLNKKEYLKEIRRSNKEKRVLIWIVGSAVVATGGLLKYFSE